MRVGLVTGRWVFAVVGVRGLQVFDVVSSLRFQGGAFHYLLGVRGRWVFEVSGGLM